MRTLVLGGVRAGKSAFAYRVATEWPGAVTYAVTAEASDEEMARRIERHRTERPDQWATIELVDSFEPLISGATQGGLVVVDCLSMFVSNLVVVADVEKETATSDDEERAWACVSVQLELLEAVLGDVVVVSNEVGMGVVPATPLGRLYRDVLGRANQRMAAWADRVVLVVAGAALELKAAGAPDA